MAPGNDEVAAGGLGGPGGVHNPERDPNTGVAVELPELPRYRSHKIVQAAQIDRFMPGADPGQESDDSVFIVPVERVPAFRVSAAYVTKHDPQPGGYYVRYADGYESWSPAETFESGYTPVRIAEQFFDGTGDFHWSTGWLFKRVENGTVRFRKIEPPTDGGVIVHEAHVPPSEWASIVASVSARGETGKTYREALALHDDESRVARVDPGGLPGPNEPALRSPVEQVAMDGSPAVVTRRIIDIMQTGKFNAPELVIDEGVGSRDEVVRIQFQCGPLHEVGVNGCSIEDVIDVLVARLAGYQPGPLACPENDAALRSLGNAKEWLMKRTARRREQGVEGTNQPHVQAP